MQSTERWTFQAVDDPFRSVEKATPLIKVKQALSRLQHEILGIDVQIGVIEQMLLQSQLRNTINLHSDLRSEFLAY
uniref:Uncharacterized protein n=1 Tax=Romanomermis culicivorax TaxID=13658 RepID=A0A915K4T6_ROMCU